MLRNSPQKSGSPSRLVSAVSPLFRTGTLNTSQSDLYCDQRVFHLSNQTIKKELEIYCWRYKTYLPIIKPLQYLMNQNTSFPGSCKQNLSPVKQYNQAIFSGPQQLQGIDYRQSITPMVSNGKSELRVKMEPIRYRLSDIDLLSFSQIIYLLKEMMIGYDALIDIFGTFEPSQQMVAISSGHQWKVWVNKDFFINTKKQPQTSIGARQFIYKLLVIAQKHCQTTSLSKLFFCQMKQFTYSNECGFIRTFEKIKEYAKVNKIFQVNKVTLPGEKVEKNFNFDSLNIKSSTNLNATAHFGTANTSQHKMKFQKTVSGPVQSPPATKPYRSTLNKSSFNMFLQPTNIAQYSTKNLQNKHTTSQKIINTSAMFYNPKSPHVMSSFQVHKGISESTDQWNKNSSFQVNSPKYKKPALSGFCQQNDDKFVLNKFNSTQALPSSKVILNSPQHQIQQIPQQGERKTSAFANMTKSRHQLKLIVNQKGQKGSNNLVVPENSKGRKNQRKYSEQIFKAKSVDALAAGAKKIRGSQFCNQDPESKHLQVNVIKKNMTKLTVPESPTQKPSNFKSSNNTTLKDPGSSTPNHSSNSTNEMQKSASNAKKQTYQYLKVNDLNSNKVRNNHSSYYGMGGIEPRRDKNMTISYEFRNRNEAQSKSSNSTEKQDNKGSGGHNWGKKISGLFSDDASIKHLKESVKFKTAQQQYFEKQYLKDVKLDLLQKFGRPVRNSMVDQDDDFRGQKNPYKSMQLIEQVADEGKSYIEKQQDPIEQEEPVMVRGRNRTVQIMKNIVQEPPQRIVQRECVSVEASQNDDSSEDCFNFESEGYNINRR